MSDMHKRIFSYLAGSALFIYGLNIPKISLAILSIAVISVLIRNSFTQEFNRAFMERLILLLLFAVSYYLFTTIHGLNEVKESVRNIFVISGAYILGYSVPADTDTAKDSGLPMLLLLMISGLITFALLCVYTYIQSTTIIQIAERMAPNFWDGSDINAPGLGACGSLGMCLLPVVLFGGWKEWGRPLFTLVAVVVIFLFSAGLFINISLQNRTPFLAAAASLFLGFVLYLRKTGLKQVITLKKAAVFGILAGLAVYFLAGSVDLLDYNIFYRFQEERLETPRFRAWQEMLSSLHHGFLGGREIRLWGGLRYVHNLWLDVIWDAGIVPFLFLVAFHLKHAVCFRNILKSELPLAVVLMIAGLATSFFFNFMQEPTMAASVPYFAISCFFLGVILRTSEEQEQVKYRH